MSRWLITANHGFINYAMEEMRRLFPGISFEQLSVGESAETELAFDSSTVLKTIADREPIFLRHIQPIERRFTLSGNADDLNRLSDIVRHASSVFEGKCIAVHVRRVEGSPYPYTASDTKELLDAVLLETGAVPSVQNAELIISLFASKHELLIGWGSPKELLSDWPGGAIRFQREEGQISRAKFKLLEAEHAFGMRLAGFREAVDIGAAPGGWTSLLLERGLHVTAIDPAELHPSLSNHPRLTYLKKNASEVSFRPASFDLLVCDMSWSPMQMAKLVLDLVPALRPGSSAVITVKLMHRKPLQTIRDVIAKLAPALELQKAKQLFHNRDEITLYLKKIEE